MNQGNETMDEASRQSSGLEWMTAPGLEPSLWHPERLVWPNSWVAHIPFAFWLVQRLRPERLVELGVHSGNSYAAFCQAVRHLGLPTRCYGVDTWAGDPHAGFYSEEIFEDLSRWHDARYADFSRLVRATFDEAATHFAPGSVDLLHIDGMHSYEAVKHDFDTWKPLLSRRAIVLFHDTNVRERDFGVWRFWAELSAEYPAFEFLHGHGLGVAAIGPDMPEALRPLFETARTPEGLGLIRNRFARLGEPLMRDILLNASRQTLQESEQGRQAAQQAKAAAETAFQQAEAERTALAARLAAAEEAAHRSQAALQAQQQVSQQAEQQSAEALETMLAAERSQAALLQHRLAETEQALAEAAARREAAQAQLDTVLHSTSWRATAQLRNSLSRHPVLRRMLRRSARLAWWIVTLQAPRRLREYWQIRRTGRPLAAPAGAAPAAEAPPAPLPQAGPTVPVKLRPEPLAAGPRPAAPAAPRGTLLCLSHVAPYPPRAGNEYRIHRMLSWLREEGWRVVLLYCPLPGEEPSEEALGRLASDYADLVLVGRDGRLRHQLSDPRAEQALQALEGRSSADFAARLDEESPGEAARLLGLVRVFSPDPLVETLLALEAALQPRAVLANYIFMTRGLPLLRDGVLKIVDTHDVFSTKAEKVSAFGIRDDLAMNGAEEGALLRRADIVLGIQPEESETLRRIAPGVEVLTIGVDMPMPAEPPVVEAPVLLLVASGNAMNVKGLQDFLRFAWPRIRAAMPGARLDVVGSVGDALPGEVEGVRRLGRVDDLAAAYAAARLVINPAVAGTGLKIKTLEALAHLKPIVLWPSGVDGISPELRGYCTLAKDWYAFGEAAIRLLGEAAPDAALRRDRARIAELLSADAAYGPLRQALEASPVRPAPAAAPAG
ncbi:glycosyltransferase involved in cell wall biosynthesis [Pseudoroseomonas cervicalis]|nr:glycosyltransferase involved in cell wall biosynthesis [Pseudoroseomonas cervicalis]